MQMTKRSALALLLTGALLTVGGSALAQTDVEELEWETAGEIAVGETVEGTVGETGAVGYTFVADADGPVNIGAVSTEFDTYLYVLDAEGTVLAEDDDSGDGFNSQVRALDVTADTEYSIVVTSYNGTAQGAFTLDVAINDTDDQIEYGETVEGDLERGGEVPYYFNGEAGDTVVVQHISEDFDSYLTLTGPDGFNVYDDDSLGNLDSQIGPVELPASGEYTVLVSAFNDDGEGRYEVRLALVDIPTAENGQRLTLDFDENTQAHYIAFDGSAGEGLSVDFEAAGDFSANVTVTDPSNFEVYTNYGPVPLVDISGIVLNTSGRHLLTIVAPSVAGSVDVTITTDDLPSLDDGPQSVNGGSTTGLNFSGEAGEQVRITATVVESDPYYTYISYDVRAGDVFLGSFSGSNAVTALDATLQLPQDGEFLVTIYSSSAETTLEFSLERLGTAPEPEATEDVSGASATETAVETEAAIETEAATPDDTATETATETN